MAVLLGYTSALEYWRSLATMQDESLHDALLGSYKERNNVTNHLQRQLNNLKSRRESVSYLADHPDASAITIGQQAHSQSQDARTSKITRLPTHSCVRANMHYHDITLYVSTPEFCFLQMASRISLEELIALGFELCGTYALLNGETIYQSIPLTTVNKLQAFMVRAKGFRGSVAARRAMKYILDRSASPMETALTMLLTLPNSLGGYGVAQPQLNYRINIPSSLADTVESHYYVCDLFWKDSSLAIEYDSNLAHAGINKTVRDHMRRSVLTALDISVLSVTWPQVKDKKAFDQLVRLVAKKTHKRLQCKDPRFAQRHTALRNKLLFSPRSKQQHGL